MLDIVLDIHFVILDVQYIKWHVLIWRVLNRVVYINYIARAIDPFLGLRMAGHNLLSLQTIVRESIPWCEPAGSSREDSLSPFVCIRANLATRSNSSRKGQWIDTAAWHIAYTGTGRINSYSAQAGVNGKGNIRIWYMVLYLNIIVNKLCPFTWNFQYCMFYFAVIWCPTDVYLLMAHIRFFWQISLWVWGCYVASYIPFSELVVHYVSRTPRTKCAYRPWVHFIFCERNENAW